jgi:hypothetical protein
MSSVLDWLSGAQPDHLEDFTRLRAVRVPSPYNPDALVADWDKPADELLMRGSWDSSGSSYGADEVREQLVTSKRIAIWDSAADVREGDRVRAADGAVFTVTGRPARDKNPWTGAQPTCVLTVEEVRG